MASVTSNELYHQVRDTQPPILYLTGKTCTGKTTFSDRLRVDCGYEVINLDDVVNDSIVKPQSLQASQGDVFVSVYKTADNAEWIDTFANAAQKRIKDLLARDKKVIVDGAIANPRVIQRILDNLPAALFVYFHPIPSSADYLRNLTNRFMGTTADNQNGLPLNFWNCINQDLFAGFCHDRVITTELEQGIARYAQQSAESSIERLETLRKDFPKIAVVEV